MSPDLIRSIFFFNYPIKHRKNIIISFNVVNFLTGRLQPDPYMYATYEIPLYYEYLWVFYVSIVCKIYYLFNIHIHYLLIFCDFWDRPVNCHVKSDFFTVILQTNLNITISSCCIILFRILVGTIGTQLFLHC